METIKTDRLLIRPFTMADLPALHQILDVELKWTGRLLSVEERSTRLSDDLAEARINKPFGRRGIVRRDGGALIGWFRLGPNFDFYDDPDTPPKQRVRTLELGIGYALSPTAWGNGYATEAAIAMLAHAWRDLAVRRVVAETGEANLRSQRVMRKLGMRVQKNPTPAWPDRMVGVIERS